MKREKVTETESEIRREREREGEGHTALVKTGRWRSSRLTM